MPMAKRIILGNKPARRLQSSSERERGEKAGGAEGTYSPLLLRGGEVAAHAHRTTAYGQGSTGGSHWPRPVRPHTSRSPGESTADTTTEIHPAPEIHACQRPARPLAGRPTDARSAAHGHAPLAMPCPQRNLHCHRRRLGIRSRCATARRPAGSARSEGTKEHTRSVRSSGQNFFVRRFIKILINNICNIINQRLQY